jgi:DNA-binding NtrC family response regulator
VTTRRADIRLIAATNHDLAELVATKAFREDLYYRLNVVPVRLPALRERPSDIPELLRHFLSLRRRTDGQGPYRFSPDAIDRLVQYAWPGNVRELKNLVERLIVTIADDPITAAHLTDISGMASGEPVPAPRTNEELKALKRHVHEVAIGRIERTFVLDALRRNDWNVSRAARDTGILRPNFHALMRKHGIRAEET